MSFRDRAGAPPWKALPTAGRVASADAAVALLAGCTAEGAPQATDNGAPPTGTLPSTHVHGVAFEPADGTVLLATHEGLFRIGEGGESTHVGPEIDLMRFAASGPEHLLASGHPAPHVDLPEPVGLIESTDGGRTWTVLSRPGVSDFHALTVSDAGVLGYDGALLRSVDGTEWEELDFPAQPHTLAAAADGQRILATTEEGLLRSSDGGASWTRMDGAPLLQIVTWAGNDTDIVGVDRSGQFWADEDGAPTWRQGAQLDAAPEAIAATSSGDRVARIVAVTTDALLESDDGGRTFEALLAG